MKSPIFLAGLLIEGLPTMKHRVYWVFGKSVGVALCAILLISAPVVAEEADVVRAIKM